MEIRRSLARQLRAVFRRLVHRHSPAPPLVSFDANADGLRVRIHRTEIAAEYRLAGSFPVETLCLPLEALADFEGRADTPVRLQSGLEGATVVSWQDGAVPRSKEYTAVDPAELGAFPGEPEQTSANGPQLWKALGEASACASDEAVRFATDKLQLRGAAGEVIATDGRQLLIQGGFNFPWQDDLLIPSTALFGVRELATGSPITVGRTASHVMLKTGGWTLHLPIDPDGRYPNWQECVPKLNGGCTRCHLDAADATFLASALPRLPGNQDDCAPITLDLNGHACVRAREGQGRVTEISLSRSRFSGPPLRLCLNRDYLARALRLGLPEMCLVNADTPLVYQDTSRRFVVMPLAKEGAIPPSTDAIRIDSGPPDTVAPSSSHERRIAPVNAPETNGHASANGQPARKPAAARGKKKEPSMAALIEECQALKEVLRAAFGRSHRLLGALKRQRRQSKIVQSTLASLRQLHQIDA